MLKNEDYRDKKQTNEILRIREAIRLHEASARVKSPRANPVAHFGVSSADDLGFDGDFGKHPCNDAAAPCQPLFAFKLIRPLFGYEETKTTTRFTPFTSPRTVLLHRLLQDLLNMITRPVSRFYKVTSLGIQLSALQSIRAFSTTRQQATKNRIFTSYVLLQLTCNMCS